MDESEYLKTLRTIGRLQFTAEDLLEGLASIREPCRRATLFGLEQRLDIDRLVNLTHKDLGQLTLTPISQQIINVTVRHIRLDYVFWLTQPDGIVTPMLCFEDEVRIGFPGMEWNNLQSLYIHMVWIDSVIEGQHFLAEARKLGLEL